MVDGLVQSPIGGPVKEFIAWLYRPAKELFYVRDETAKAIEAAKLRQLSAADKQLNRPNSSPPPPLIDSLLLNSKSTSLPATDLTTARLTDELLTILLAGTVTTAQTLTLALYFILTNPSIESRLRAELAPLYPSPSTTKSLPPTWTALSHLPYLTATITESLRLAYGVSHRLPRISALPLALPSGSTVPANTPVSMTHMHLHNNPCLFPHPLSFAPERWLDPASSAVSRRFFVPFSRGRRACLGTNLAWAEMYLGIAGMLRPLELGGIGGVKVWETGEEEVRVKRDYFNPAPVKGAVGVRIVMARE
jgi:cytochrome P450